MIYTENKIITVIKNRVSCRNYTNQKVSLAKVKQIAECGMMAPSGKNRQIANILIVRDKNHVEKLRNLSWKHLQRDCFYGANTMILVYAPRNDKFCIQDSTCILENMFIAASALKIHSCWINQVDDLFNTEEGKKIKKSWKIPAESMIVGTCIVGYSAEPEKLMVKPRKEDFIKIL